MDEAYIGEIRMFAGATVPDYWMLCNGDRLSVRAYEALSRVIGNKFGGDGVEYFLLPNLMSRVPLGTGEGKGLTPREIGDSGGSSTYTLKPESTPPHSHSMNGSLNAPTTTSPEGAFLASSAPRTTNRYKLVGDPKPTLLPLAEHTIKATGSFKPVENLQPTLTLSFIICINGVYPPKP
jgi:microcystin-dependent protein